MLYYSLNNHYYWLHSFIPKTAKHRYITRDVVISANKRQKYKISHITVNVAIEMRIVLAAVWLMVRLLKHNGAQFWIFMALFPYQFLYIKGAWKEICRLNYGYEKCALYWT
jgi:hypothetical protein